MQDNKQHTDSEQYTQQNKAALTGSSQTADTHPLPHSSTNDGDI